MTPTSASPAAGAEPRHIGILTSIVRDDLTLMGPHLPHLGVGAGEYVGTQDQGLTTALVLPLLFLPLAAAVAAPGWWTRRHPQRAQQAISTRVCMTPQNFREHPKRGTARISLATGAVAFGFAAVGVRKGGDGLEPQGVVASMFNGLAVALLMAVLCAVVVLRGGRPQEDAGADDDPLRPQHGKRGSSTRREHSARRG